MTNIRQLITEYIQDGQAEYTVQDGQAGVIFKDEGEFIPLSDLGYNRELGFYRLSLFPEESNEADTSLPWSVHPIESDDAELPPMYALLSDDGHGFVLGERWQAQEAFEVLRRFIEAGETAEPIPSDADELGTHWLSISEACLLANEYDPERYPLNGETLQMRIRQAARRGSLKGAVQTPTGRWKFQERHFRAWLRRNREE